MEIGLHLGPESHALPGNGSFLAKQDAARSATPKPLGITCITKTWIQFAVNKRPVLTGQSLMTAMLTPTEVESFAKFAASQLHSDCDSGTSRTKPYQIYSPLAGFHLDQEHADKACAPDLSSSEAHFTQLRGPSGSANDRRAMRERFVETTPKWMRCSDKLDFGSSLEKKSAALNCKYVKPNSDNRIAWQIFDLDFPGAADKFDDANVAVPNFIVENPSSAMPNMGMRSKCRLAPADGRGPTLQLPQGCSGRNGAPPQC